MMKIFLILAAIAVAANAQDEVEPPTENVSCKSRATPFPCVPSYVRVIAHAH
jgi:hypothetical protein